VRRARSSCRLETLETPRVTFRPPIRRWPRRPALALMAGHAPRPRSYRSVDRVEVGFEARYSLRPWPVPARRRAASERERLGRLPVALTNTRNSHASLTGSANKATPAGSAVRWRRPARSAPQTLLMATVLSPGLSTKTSRHSPRMTVKTADRSACKPSDSPVGVERPSCNGSGGGQLNTSRGFLGEGLVSAIGRPRSVT
jgi:hypothetical protein